MTEEEAGRARDGAEGRIRQARGRVRRCRRTARRGRRAPRRDRGGDRGASGPPGPLRSGRDRARGRFHQHRRLGDVCASSAAMSGPRTRPGRSGTEASSRTAMRLDRGPAVEPIRRSPRRRDCGSRRTRRRTTASGRSPTGSSRELTAHRTLALRDALANEPDSRLPGGASCDVPAAFYRYGRDSCIEIEREERRSRRAGARAQRERLRAVDRPAHRELAGRCRRPRRTSGTRSPRSTAAAATRSSPTAWR